MNRTQNRENFAPLVSFIDAAKATFNAKVLYCENGQHKAGKPVELDTGENLLQVISRAAVRDATNRVIEARNQLRS